jgi:alanyl-tRNA synthetase
MIKTRKELIDAYIQFFKGKNHAVIPGASLIPENDPSVLFTTAGMHPLVPFLMGRPHPAGKRLVNVQKCVRTGDIEEAGDSFHLTFFEMLGNWSLGDYFKEEAIEWSFEFLTSKKWLGLPAGKLCITVFAGDKDTPKDDESAKIWHSLGIPKERIFYLPKSDNWWGPAGATGPCGPDTEIFVDTGRRSCSKSCMPGCKCGRYFEVWNDVFMEYNKTKEGKYELLKQRNVDTGMGVERTVAMLLGKKSVYETELFLPIMEHIKKISKLKKLDEKQERAARIIADHIKAATFILGDGVVPSNLDRGYVLRRLIRRAARYGRILGITANFTKDIANIVIEMYKPDYHELSKNAKTIKEEIEKEENRFRDVLEKGLKEFEKVAKGKKISGENAFMLYQSYGFPIEMTKELADEKNISVDEKGFEKKLMEHQEKSRTAAEGMFKSGLADHSEQTTKLHTATHLLGQALREVLGSQVQQRGSNITPERLRFDFNFERKLTDEELSRIEAIVNKKIKENLKIERKEMTVEEAKKLGAQAMFSAKYGEKVSVYSIWDYSTEICAGPHAKNTKELGHFKIIREESVAAGIRRIRAILQ